MIELEDDRLEFSFPEVHSEARCSIEFQRTLRIPDDNRTYPLPPGFGTFPLAHVDDYAQKVPHAWRAHGGVFMPMYQAEAMWICFHGDYPFAVKIAAGKIDAVTGEPWRNDLTRSPQDYVVIPDQPWLDGFCVQEGRIRQFVAMPLGEGYSAEEQITGQAEHGGVQIVVYPMKAAEYERRRKRWEREALMYEAVACLEMEAPLCDMGLAPGGLMKQEIFEDEYGFDVWDTTVRSRCFVHIANSVAYLQLTGRRPPTRAPTAKQYTDAGLPWFDYYGADLKALEGAKKLAGLDSVAAKGIKQGEEPLPENEPVKPDLVKTLIGHGSVVREGEF